MQFQKFAIYTGGRILNASLSLATLFVINRMISPADYGRYSYYTILGGLLSLLCFGWVWSLNLRHGNESDFSVQYQNSLYWIVLAFPVLLIIILLFSSSTGAGFIECVYLAIYAPLLALFNSEQKMHAAKSLLQQNIAYGLTRTLTNLIVLSLFIYFISKEKSLYIASIMGYLCVFTVLLRLEVYGKRNEKLELPKRVNFNYGFGISIAVLITQLNYSIDKFVINYYLGDESTGQYYHSYEIIHFIIMFIYSIYNVNVYPPLQRSYDNNEKTLQQVLRVSLKYFSSIAVVLVIALLLTKSIFTGIISDEYKFYFSHLYEFNVSVALLTCFVAFNINYAFQLVKKPKVRIYIGVLAVLANVPLSIVFIHWYGLRGVAAATVVSQILIILSSTFYIKFTWK